MICAQFAPRASGAGRLNDTEEVMRATALLCASALALAAGPFAIAAFAAPAPSAASEAPKYYRLTQGDPAAEKACVDKGGTVKTDRDGNKMCNMGNACPVGAATRTVKLDANDSSAE